MMRLSKVFKITTLIVACTVVLIGGAIIFRRIHSGRPENKILSTREIAQNVDVPGDWLRLVIQNDVALYIPSSFKSDNAEPWDGYKRLRSGSMEIIMDYGLAQHVSACVVQDNQIKASAIKVEPTRVDGKEARIEKVDRIPFNLDDDAKLAVKGFIICVPNVGDDTHEFAVVGKYKSPEDYQTLYRIVDSVKFLKRRS